MEFRKSIRDIACSHNIQMGGYIIFCVLWGGPGLGQIKDGEEKIIKSDKGLFSSHLNYSSVNDIWEGLEFMVLVLGM